jgi:hypothetical protein
MNIDNLPWVPEMFEKAFGPRFGPPIWRLAFVVGLLLFFGGAIYAAIHGINTLRSEVGSSSPTTTAPPSPTYAYILSLVDVAAIQDTRNPDVDLSIGLNIKNSADGSTKFLVDAATVSFNGADGKTAPIGRNPVVIRKGDTTLYNINSISEINKSISGLINVGVEFSIIYGPLDSKFQRRWSYGFKFKFDPTVLGHERYTVDYERDEPIDSK